MFGAGRNPALPGMKWTPPPPPQQPQDYGGERFWDPMYRSSPGMATIMDALGRHNSMIGDRVSALREAAAQAQAGQGGATQGGDAFPASRGWQQIAPGTSFRATTPFWDLLKQNAAKAFLGKDQKIGVSDAFRNLYGGFAGAGVNAGRSLAGAGWDWAQERGGLGGLFGGFDIEGNPGAASEAYLENIRNMGLGQPNDPSGRGMADPSGGMMGGPRSGAPLDPGMAGFGAGPDWIRPDATAPGIPGFGGPGGSYGGAGLPPGMTPNPMNPNLSMDWSYMIQPAGGGPGIPVISGPQWIGPQPTMSGYPPGQEPWMMGGFR